MDKIPNKKEFGLEKFPFSYEIETTGINNEELEELGV